MKLKLFQKSEKPKEKAEKVSNKECFLALDIGTEAVKAAVFSREKDKKIIFGSGIRYYDRFGVFNSRDFETDVVKKAIINSVEEARKQAQAKIKSAYISLPPNVVKARIVFESIGREKPKELINEKEEEEITKEIFTRAEARIIRDFSRDDSGQGQDIEFVAKQMLQIKMDGYKIPALKKYDGERLDFVVLLIFLPKNYFKIIKNVTDGLGISISKIVHEAEGLSRFFRDYDGIFLDIGGKITQIFLVRSGVLEFSGEFEGGGENFTKAISDALGFRSDDARFFKEGYAKQFLTKEVQDKVAEILRPCFSKWMSVLFSKLQKSKNPIFSNIFVFGGGSLLPGFREAIKAGAWGEFNFTDGPLFELVNTKTLDNIEDRSKKLATSRDIPLLLITSI